MPTIRRSPRAAEDLIELWTHIAVDDPAAADRMLDLIEAKLARLAVNPRLAPPVRTSPRTSPVPCPPYSSYRVLPDGIEVVRVVHGMRRLGGLA